MHGHGYWVGLGVAGVVGRCHHLARVVHVKWWGFARVVDENMEAVMGSI